MYLHSYYEVYLSRGISQVLRTRIQKHGTANLLVLHVCPFLLNCMHNLLVDMILMYVFYKVHADIYTPRLKQIKSESSSIFTNDLLILARLAFHVGNHIYVFTLNCQSIEYRVYIIWAKLLDFVALNT